MNQAREGTQALRLGLRTIAVGIAVAAVIDPVRTATIPAVREVVAIDLTSGVSDAVAADLQTAAPGWQVVRRRVAGPRLPCGRHERCVAIADGSIDVTVPSDVGALSLIAMHSSASPNVALQSAVAAIGHASAAGAMRVEMSRTGAVSSTDLRVRDGEAIVGTATHKWGDEHAVALDVPWWPLGVGARALRVETVPAEGETITIDNTLDVGAAIESAPMPVLVFDARPSWGSTFVRRALEDDERFVVQMRSRVAPGLTAGTPGGALTAAALDAAPVVLIGGPDALTAADVALLERYVSDRGGSVILLPERRIDGPISRLAGSDWRERLTPAPQQVGLLRASEILHLERLPAAATVLAHADTAPAIAALPAGRGRVIVSGAMDAWRHRDGGDFDRFWTSLVAGAAVEGRALTIDVDASLAAKGERVPVAIRYRTLNPSDATDARATLRCGNQTVPVRLWPSGTVGDFVGELPAVESGPCQIDVGVGEQSATAFVAVAEQPNRGTTKTLTKLERITRGMGGVVANRGQESEIAAALDDSSADSSQIVSVRPMQSPWWIVPFAAALSAEWWLRRRAGFA